MHWSDLLAALALVLVLEGLMPFLSPDSYRRVIRAAIELDDVLLRTIGVVSMIVGLALLLLVR